MSRRRLTDAVVGDHLPELVQPVDRAALIRYAGASGDFNVIHWDDEAAKAAGLPGVIAHGMYSFAVAARMVTAYAGDPAAVRRLKVRFSAMTRPGETLTATGSVAEVDGNLVRISFSAQNDAGERVLSKGEAELELS